MMRYSHDTGVYRDLMLGKIPFQFANVIVHIKRRALDNFRDVECVLDGYGLVYNATYSSNERLRGYQLRDAILQSLHSNGQASGNTKIALVRSGSNEVIKLSLLVWIPSDFGRHKGKAKSLPELLTTHVQKRPSAASVPPKRQKPTSVTGDTCEVKKGPSAPIDIQETEMRPFAASCIPKVKKRTSVASDTRKVQSRPPATGDLQEVDNRTSAASDTREVLKRPYASSETRKVGKRPSAASNIL
jgi:hypothetical protein